MITGIVFMVICGGIAAAIGHRKNLTPLWQWFLAGCLLPVIGIILVLWAPRGLRW